MMNYYCQNCEKKLEDDYEPVTCCNGHECGCMGRLLEPVVCSSECWDIMIKPATTAEATNETKEK